MDPSEAADADRAEVARTTAALLAAVNTSDADRCSALWAADGVLMPPQHPSVQGRPAIVQYFRNLFSRARFRFAFTSSHIHIDGDTALERVTYTATIWPGDDALPIEDVGKGLTRVSASANRLVEADVRYLEQRLAVRGRYVADPKLTPAANCMTESD